MKKLLSSFTVVVLGLALLGCDKHGVYAYGVRTDVVNGAGTGELFLRSSDTGTDIVILGGVSTTGATPFLSGTVERDSSTTLFLGSCRLNGSEDGTFDVTASYEFPYQPALSVAARDGSQRSDFAEPFPLTLTIDRRPDGKVDIGIDGVVHTYTRYDDVVTAVNLSSATGPSDLFQLYNLGLFFSQVRIPAFGSIGMTRYITQTGRFNGLIAGDYSVAVASLANPTATLTYNALEDFPGEVVGGSIVTAVNLSGDGPMHGIMTFEITGGTDIAPVVYSGSVNYENITVSNGLAASGQYAMTVTVPTAVTASMPYTYSANVDLRNILPVTP